MTCSLSFSCPLLLPPCTFILVFSSLIWFFLQVFSSPQTFQMLKSIGYLTLPLLPRKLLLQASPAAAAWAHFSWDTIQLLLTFPSVKKSCVGLTSSCWFSFNLLWNIHMNRLNEHSISGHFVFQSLHVSEYLYFILKMWLTAWQRLKFYTENYFFLKHLVLLTYCFQNPIFAVEKSSAFLIFFMQHIFFLE